MGLFLRQSGDETLKTHLSQQSYNNHSTLVAHNLIQLVFRKSNMCTMNGPATLRRDDNEAGAGRSLDELGDDSAVQDQPSDSQRQLDLYRMEYGDPRGSSANIDALKETEMPPDDVTGSVSDDQSSVFSDGTHSLSPSELGAIVELIGEEGLKIEDPAESEGSEDLAMAELKKKIAARKKKEAEQRRKCFYCIFVLFGSY